MNVKISNLKQDYGGYMHAKTSKNSKLDFGGIFERTKVKTRCFKGIYIWSHFEPVFLTKKLPN